MSASPTGAIFEGLIFEKIIEVALNTRIIVKHMDRDM